MSLMKSLARVAAGVMLAKGIGAMMRRSQDNSPGTAQNQSRDRQTGDRQTGGGLLGDLFGTGGASRSGGGGLGDMLGQVLGGRSAANPGTGRPYGGPVSQGGASGGLGGMLDNMTGRTSAAGSGSGGGLLGGLLGGAAGGGLGGMLGDLLNGPAQRDAQPQNDRSFGELFNDALANQGEPDVAPTPEQNAVAGLMLKAMIQAAKSDGKIDDKEKQRLLGQLGDLDDDERQFIREQMAAPVDAEALARDVPKGLEKQVYTMSVMAIDFDNQNEARYLRDLAQAMGLNGDQVSRIHDDLGVQNLPG